MTYKYERLQGYDTYNIPVLSIYFDGDFNCRGLFSPESCLELAESIRDKGLQFPIVVQPRCDAPDIPDGYDFRLVAGHRRYTAVRYCLRQPTIAAVVREGLDYQAARILNLIENIARRDLSLWEEALTLRNTFTKYNSTRIAAQINKSKRWVQLRWQLLDMPEEIQAKVRAGILKATDLKYLSGRNTAEQIAIAQELATAKDAGESTRKTVKKLKLAKVRKTIPQMRSMMTRLLIEGIEADAGRALLWACGELTDEEFTDGA